MPPSAPAPERIKRLSDLLAEGAEYRERDLPLGSMEPTHLLVPEAEFTHGHDAIELAEICGYDLMDFQREGLIGKLGANMVELRDGSKVERWAAQETADVLSRRNGKSVEIEVLILTALFLLREDKIMYTAHRDDTAKLIFDNVVQAISRVPKLWAEIIDSGPRVANGQRAIQLKTGQVVYFRTRTNDAARGQGYNRLILDEAQDLDEEKMKALMPLVTGADNAQLNYAGSAGDLKATVMAKVWRSYEVKERGLYYRGWHAEPEDDFDDLELIARMNPRLGRGLSYEFVAKEFKRLTRQGFGHERCGVATYPREEGAGWVIPEKAWNKTFDKGSQIGDGNKPRFVLEADPDLEYGTIGMAGRRQDGAMHIEALMHDPGVEWMVAEAKELQAKSGGEIWIDPKGPLEFTLGDLREAGVQVKLFTAGDLLDAWAWISTAANPKPDPRDPGAPTPNPRVLQRGGQRMTQALAAAELRKLRDRYTLRRYVSGAVNQGPIIGPMLAGWAVVKSEKHQPPPPPPVSRMARSNTTRSRPNPRHRSGRGDEPDLATTGF